MDWAVFRPAVPKLTLPRTAPRKRLRNERNTSELPVLEQVQRDGLMSLVEVLRQLDSEK